MSFLTGLRAARRVQAQFVYAFHYLNHWFIVRSSVASWHAVQCLPRHCASCSAEVPLPNHGAALCAAKAVLINCLCHSEALFCLLFFEWWNPSCKVCLASAFLSGASPLSALIACWYSSIAQTPDQGSGPLPDRHSMRRSCLGFCMSVTELMLVSCRLKRSHWCAGYAEPFPCEVSGREFQARPL